MRTPQALRQDAANLAGDGDDVGSRPIAQADDTRQLTWRRLLSVPGVKRLVAATFFGRVAASMLPLALMLEAQQQSGSLAYSGVLAGVLAGATAVGGLLQARLLARLGPRSILSNLAASSTLAVSLLLVAVAFSWPRLLVVFLAVLSGVTRPYTASIMRVVWKRVLVDPGARLAAEAFEATAFPVAFSVGPVLLALLTTVSTPAAALLVAAALGCGASLAFAGSPILARPSISSARRPGRRNLGPGLRLTGLVVLGLSMFCGSEAVPVVVSALGGGRASSAELELLISLLPFGGVVGGLAATRIRSGRSIESQLMTVLAVLAASLVSLAEMHGIVAIGVLLFIAGIARAPAIACLFHLAGECQGGESVEAIAWLAMTSYVGGALCRPLAGMLADGPGAHVAGLTVAAPLLIAMLAIAVTTTAWRRPTWSV